MGDAQGGQAADPQQVVGRKRQVGVERDSVKPSEAGRPLAAANLQPAAGCLIVRRTFWLAKQPLCPSVECAPWVKVCYAALGDYPRQLENSPRCCGRRRPRRCPLPEVDSSEEFSRTDVGTQASRGFQDGRCLFRSKTGTIEGMRMRFLPDEPLREQKADLFGLSPFVDLVVRALENTSSPFVFGVLGDWGTGKTSILRLLDASLRSRGGANTPHLLPIWFDAWRYENEVNAVYPLLHSIKRSYDQSVPRAAGDRAFAESFLKVATASVLTAADLGLRVLTKHFTGEALKLGDVKDQLKQVEDEAGVLGRVLERWADSVAELSEAFQTLVDRYAEDYAAAHGLAAADVVFVIFIDDLDRCLPERAIDLLERIKNFLAVRRCIFVLGLNAEVIHQGVRVKYRGVEIDGRQYLEKILNYAFHVPEPEPARIRDFATSQLATLLPDGNAALEANFVTFGEVLSACAFNNPRKIKRILNRYLLFLDKFGGRLVEYEMGNVVRMIVLAEYFPALFRLYLAGADARTELGRIGSDDFEIEAFESRFGVALASSYAELRRMRDLFKMIEPLPAQKLRSLALHAADVFAITRL